MTKVSDSVFISACRRLPVKHTPVWIMRQAGRYLPQYREIRSKYSFFEMCKTPAVAAEVTVQPVDFLGVDAAILFSDIMIPLEGMGAGVYFSENGGPVIENPISGRADVDRLVVPVPEETTPYVMAAIGETLDRLGGRVPLIGFCGAPFTLASYMIEGGHSHNYLKTKKLMYNEPEAWHELMDKLVRMLIAYLKAQVSAGVDALQVFDSWIGCLAPADYDDYVMPHMKRLFAGMADAGVPMIHFGADTATLLERLRDAGGDVIGVDWRINIDEARGRIGPDRAVQGNLDPTVLFAPTDVIRRKVEDILKRVGSEPGHVFNLGHGVLPQTPPDNVKAMVDMVHEISAKGRA